MGGEREEVNMQWLASFIIKMLSYTNTYTQIQRHSLAFIFYFPLVVHSHNVAMLFMQHPF